MPSLRGRAALVQRAILTAISDIRLVDCEYDVLSNTVGSVARTDLCTIVFDVAESTARLQLVLERKNALDYGQIAACIDARIADLDCLSGRESKLLRNAGLSLVATVSLHVGTVEPASVVRADASTSPAIIHLALNHLSATDRMLGVRDLRLVSLEQRLNLLLSLGMEEDPRQLLDETMHRHADEDAASSGGEGGGSGGGEGGGGGGRGGGSGGGGGGGCCPIEEIGESSLDEACCATGCEPCVWETYYRQQVRERGKRGSNGKSSSGKSDDSGEGMVKKRLRTATSTDKSSGSSSESAAPAVHAPTGPPTSPVLLEPERMLEVRLLARRQHTTDMLLLTFGACVAADPPPAPPWHVRLRLAALDGEAVTRAYTVLRCEGGHLELLIKVHRPHGRCSQALASLRVGQSVQARGPIATDDSLNGWLFPQLPPPAPRPPAPSKNAVQIAAASPSLRPHPLTQPVAVSPTPALATAASSPAASPSVLHCLSAGSGISPMVQITEALVRSIEGLEQQQEQQPEQEQPHADAGVRDSSLMPPRAPLMPPRAPLMPHLRTTIIRIWSVNRLAADAVVPAYLASLQQRARSVGRGVHLTSVFTRESPASDPPPTDPCLAFGGSSRVVAGRPELADLLEGVSAAELAVAALVICGPSSFNDSMRAAAQEAGYGEGRVFVRDTPLER